MAGSIIMGGTEKEVVFIRHGEHPTSQNTESEYLCGLTKTGLEEARGIGLRIAEKYPDGIARAYTIRKMRSIATSVLVVHPEISNLQLVMHVAQEDQTNEIVIDERFEYGEAPVTMLNELSDAFVAKQALRYHVANSKRLTNVKGYNISTYDDMSSKVAQGLGEMQGDADTSGNLVVCAREFFYPSFRAKLIEMSEGTESRDRYVDWYGDQKEWNPDARVDTSTVTLNTQKLEVADDYGKSQYPLSILHHLRIN